MSAAPAESRTPRILVVDDHPENLLALEVVLKGYDLTTATSGTDALKRLLEQDFALIVLDVQMREMDGFQTAELIRARERSRHTPIIFLTGISKHDRDIHRGYAVGAVDYVFKPFTPEVLRAKVAVFIELFEKTRQIEEQAAALEALNRELRRSNAELDGFASIAAHDLQEPLRKIVSFGDRLRLRLDAILDDESRDSLARMQASAGRLSKLIMALLEFSRVTTKARSLEPVPLDAVAQEVLGDLEERIHGSGGRVDVGPLPVIQADREQMRALLLNLIGNALKFARKGAPPRVAVTAVALEDGGVRLEVADQGVGFEQRFAERIFQPFQRLHPRNEYEGTGIGLAICQKIVRRHGGTITARGLPGNGAVFTVRLPKAPAPEPQETRPPEQPASAGPS